MMHPDSLADKGKSPELIQVIKEENSSSNLKSDSSLRTENSKSEMAEQERSSE